MTGTATTPSRRQGLGTAWTGAGEGATPAELAAALADPARSTPHSPDLRRRLMEAGDAQTRLRLTGARLGLYDLRRIEEVLR